MNAHAPAARDRLVELVQRPDQELDLAAAALQIAAEEYTQLRPETYLRRLDVLAERVRDRLSDETAPALVLHDLGRVLFQEEGFRGNTDAYYDPRNSFLNDVLDRRLGIPLTLGIVHLEVGWRLGLPLSGINFPGHFLVGYEGEALRVLVDPFDGGRLRFEDQLQGLLDRVYGGTVRLRPEFLRPAGRRDMLVRLLTNLKSVYARTGDDARSLAAIERILLIRPDAVSELRDRGLLLARLGRVEEAEADLRAYLEHAPEAADAGRVRSALRRLAE